MNIDVWVPEQLVEQIDAEYEERGYTSRSEVFRDTLRAWLIRRCDSLRKCLQISRPGGSSVNV